MSGHLKVSVSSQDGGEKVIEILSPRQLFGVAELFGDSPCVSSVETVTPVVMLAVGRDSVLRAIEQAGYRPGAPFAAAVGISYYGALLPYQIGRAHV